MRPLIEDIAQACNIHNKGIAIAFIIFNKQDNAFQSQKDLHSGEAFVGMTKGDRINNFESEVNKANAAQRKSKSQELMTVMPSTGARIANFEPGRITTGQHCSKGQAYRAIGGKIISKSYEEKKALENEIQMSASLMMSKEADLMISKYRKGIIWDRIEHSKQGTPGS
jgi:hypothetical protein